MGFAPATEEQFLATVLEYAVLMGWRVYHTRDSRGSHAGFPDLVLVKDGRLVFAELKTARGRLRPAQVLWLADLARVAEAAGGAVAVYQWTPESWPEIEKVLGGAS